MSEQTAVLEPAVAAQKPAVKPSAFRWAVLATSCLSVIAFQVSVMSYSPLLGEIARNLGITLAQSVSLMTAFMLFAAISYFVGGPLCDRYGIAPVIIASTLFSALPGTAILWLGHSYSGILAVRALQGCAVGFTMPAMAPLVLRWFAPKQRGLALGIPGACNPFGVIIGVIVAPVLFRATGSWQHAIGYMSMISWFAFAYCVAVFRVSKRFAPAEINTPEEVSTSVLFGKAMRWHYTWIGVIVTFAVNWIMQSAFSLSPSYFAEAKPLGLGFGPVAAGQWMGVVQIGAIIGPIVGGILLDKAFNGRARGVVAMAFLFSLSYVGLRFPAVCDNRGLFIACLAISGAGIGMLFPAIQTEINELYERSIVGRMNGVWLGIGAFGGSAGLAATAMALKQTGSYALPINIISCAAILGLALCAVHPRGSASR